MWLFVKLIAGFGALTFAFSLQLGCRRYVDITQRWHANSGRSRVLAKLTGSFFLFMVSQVVASCVLLMMVVGYDYYRCPTTFALASACLLQSTPVQTTVVVIWARFGVEAHASRSGDWQSTANGVQLSDHFLRDWSESSYVERFLWRCSDMFYLLAKPCVGGCGEGFLSPLQAAQRWTQADHDSTRIHMALAWTLFVKCCLMWICWIISVLLLSALVVISVAMKCVPTHLSVGVGMVKLLDASIGIFQAVLSSSVPSLVHQQIKLNMQGGGGIANHY